MDSEIITTLIGVSGAAVILMAFIFNQTDLLKNNSFWYDLMNFVGSILLVIYAVFLSSIPFVILNTVWGLFSFKDMVFKKKTEPRKKNFR